MITYFINIETDAEVDPGNQFETLEEALEYASEFITEREQGEFTVRIDAFDDEEERPDEYDDGT
jgi:hypothetical protein